jgi:hypothetical protein
MLSQTINRKSHVTSADLSPSCDSTDNTNPDPELADHPRAANVGCSEQHCAQVRHWKAVPAQQT